MMSPRWRKVMRDLWLNRSRAVLVILAIAVGVFGVGAILSGYAVVTQEMNANYLGTNPASATFRTTDPVDDEFIRSMQELHAIGEAEARRTVTGRIQIGPDEWRTIYLFVINDFNDIRVSTFSSERGAWPPDTGDILIERSALPLIKSDIGDTVVVKTPNGPRQKLRITGIVHDPGQPPGWMDNVAYGYITLGTLELLGEQPYLDELKIVIAENQFDKEYIRSTAYKIRDWIENKGIDVYEIEIPNPGKHPHIDQMVTMISLLGTFGVLALILSGILVATMISALLSSQVRQIGIMKALGATTSVVMGIYFGQVLVLSLMGLAIGIPAGIKAGWAFALFSVDIFNFNIMTNEIPVWVFAVQVSMGVLIPIMAAAYPIYCSSQVTVREAISDYGVGDSGTSSIDLLLGKIRGIGMLQLISLRNTFRRRARLVLTLGTLAAGGAVFMAAMNVAVAWDKTLDSTLDSRLYDIDIMFNRPYQVERIEQAFRDVPGVVRMESWGFTRTSRVHSDGSNGDNFDLFAPPADTGMLDLPLLEGRWLLPDDKNALVITPRLMDLEPDIKVGDTIVLSIDGQDSTWYVVGLARAVGPTTVYANYNYFTGITNTRGFARDVKLATEMHDEAAQLTVSQMLEKRMENEGLDVSSTAGEAVFKKALRDHIEITLVLLLLMSILVVIVGGLGLMSAMGINVLERIREIGIMQAIGASPGTVERIFILEGIVIGVLSWIIANLLALPLSIIAGNISGKVFLDAPLDFGFSLTGVFLWLTVVVIFAAIASFYPAWKASQLTVNEILAYE